MWSIIIENSIHFYTEHRTPVHRKRIAIEQPAPTDVSLVAFGYVSFFDSESDCVFLLLKLCLRTHTHIHLRSLYVSVCGRADGCVFVTRQTLGTIGERAPLRILGLMTWRHTSFAHTLPRHSNCRSKRTNTKRYVHDEHTTHNDSIIYVKWWLVQKVQSPKGIYIGIADWTKMSVFRIEC